MSPTNHPSESQLRDFSLGQVDAAQSDRIFAHLSECAECCSLLDGLASRDGLLSQLQSVAARDGSNPNDPDLIRRMLSIERGEPQPSERGAPRSEPRSIAAIGPAQQVGNYRLLEEVGRGGMGVVFKAKDRLLNRVVAIKMVLSGEFASEAQRSRFQLEAELAARVQHPNIVRVYEVGTHDSRPFLALEWVDGGSLAERLDGRPWPASDAARFVETLARAIHAAHSRGVIHRDLKPANILLEPDSQADRVHEHRARPEGSAGGKFDLNTVIPKIADFGLARASEGAGSFTRTGYIVGTPNYMAPEQAAGDHNLMAPPTDVYALGVILYELLTGLPPFHGKPPMEMLEAIRSSEPRPPRQLQPRLSRDLEAIVQRCLEKDPHRRYLTAAALAEDLRRYREGRSIEAQPVSTIGRAVRWCRRHPSTAALLSSLAVVLVSSFVLVTWKWVEAADQRSLAQANERSALHQAYRGRIAAALAAFEAHDVNEAARQIEACPEGLREWEWRHLHSRLDESTFSFEPREGETLSAFMVEGAPQVLSSTSERLRILDLEGREIRSIANRSEIPWARALANRAVVRFIRSDSKGVTVLDDEGKPLLSVPFPCEVALSPDLEHLAAFAGPGAMDLTRALIYDTTTGSQVRLAAGHKDFVYKAAFSPGGDRLATASEDATARVWDRATGKELGVLRGHVVKVLNVAFSPDGTRLVTASADGTVRQWDAETSREIGVPYERHVGEVLCAVYSPDGTWIASAGTDGTVRVWNASDRRDVSVLHGHTSPVRELTFGGDGRWLASSSEDGTLKFWYMDAQRRLPALKGHTSYVYPVRFTPDGKWIASGSWDATVRLWDARTGLECGVLRHPSRLLDLDVGPDGRWLVTGCGEDDLLRIWSTESGQLLKGIKGPGRWIISVSVRPDGTRIAAVDNRGKAGTYDVRTGESLESFPAGGYKRVAYDPTGRWLAVSGDSRLELRDQRQPDRVFELGIGATSLAFSLDGRMLVSAGQDRGIRVWELPGGRCRMVLRGHANEIFALAIHPQGKRIVSAGRDGTIRIWEATSGEEVARLKGHLNYVWSLAFSPDGGTLASGSGDGTIRLWDTEAARLRHRAQRDAEALRPRAEAYVRQQFQEKKGSDLVIEAIRSDRTLEEPFRSSALSAALRQATLPPTRPSDAGGARE